MKMEADSLKLKTAHATDAGGLTFGPAWLRQLSSGDTNKNALPPSPGLAFQLSKHRYSREEMLAIYETIEKSLIHKSPPNLAEEFEELHRKDLQRPILLTPPSLEEQKFLSTCVNSQVVLNMYNKIQGSQPGGQATTGPNGSVAGSRHGEPGGRGESRGGSSSMRGGSRGGGRGGGGIGGSERGRGRGTGGRGGMRGGHEPQFKTIDEESGQVSSRGGGSRGGGSYKGSYARAGWEEREQGGRGGETGVNGGGEKRYSKAMAEDNWRNRAAPAEDSDESEGGSRNVGEEAKGENESDSNDWRNAGEKKSSSSSGNQSESAQTQREWPSSGNKQNYSQAATSNSGYESRNRESYSRPRDSQPEWLDDDGEDNSMTFDTSGKFISVKELVGKKPTNGESSGTAKEKETTPVVVSEAEVKANKADEVNSQKSEKKETKQLEATSTVSPSSNVNINNNNNNNSKLQESDNSDASIIRNSSAGNLQQQQQQEQQKIISNEQSADLLKGQPTFESLQAIHHNLQQQQLKLKNDLLLASLNVDPKRGAVPSDHQDADRWFYLDPQNQIQGSFSSEQMAGWFAAGYFRLDLMIKRGRDDKFSPLGVVSNNWGRIPFTSGPTPPTLPQPAQLQKPVMPQQQQPTPQQPQPTKEQIIQQMQLFQRFQQMQLMPQNMNILRNELTGHNSGNSMANLGLVMQQMQQLQLQQNAALAATVSLGTPTTNSRLS